MGGDDYLDDSELGNLPPEAWGNTFDVDGPFDPDDFWIENAEPDQQRTAMREWFTARYCDPALETPYNGREGGYLFIAGGPYRPGDELHARFGKLVPAELIEEVVGDLVMSVGEEWAPIRYSAPPDYYDDRFDLELVSAEEPLRRVRTRVQDIQTILAAQADPAVWQLVSRMTYSALIGVLEAFLWETAQHWIDTRPDVLRRCVEKLPFFREQSMRLSDVFSEHERIKESVKGYLQNIIWHRWDQVGALYKTGLDVKLPSFKPFQEPLVRRHHIVHRSGNDLDGNPIYIGPGEVEELATEVVAFSGLVAAACTARFAAVSSGADAAEF